MYQVETFELNLQLRHRRIKNTELSRVESRPQRLLICFGGLVLFVTDLFHPLNRLAVELFLNGDVRHRRRRRGAPD